jgi:vacuolar-type H+-ATPase subunit E/Vma4
MPDINEKLDIFKQIVLDDAASERDALIGEVTAATAERLAQAEAQIKRETEAKVQAQASAISGESGREISRKLLQNKRIIATRREEIAHEVFALVREKLLAFTQTPDYLEHLKALYVEAFSSLGNPYDGVILLREEDLQYSKALAATLPGRHVTFQAGSFKLGGLIVDCHSKLLRADQSYDTALGDLDGHFAELFGLSLADD